MKKEKLAILIQGALDIEIQYLVDSLENTNVHKIAGYEFYEGLIGNFKIIVSKTLVGSINAATATVIGIMHFNPIAVINQGIAGSHSENLHIGDIIIGESCLNINSYKMPIREKGKGSDPFEWELSKRAKETINADLKLLELVYKKLNTDRLSVFKGVLGSGDVFNREYDRIIWLHNTFNTLCEDMESIGVYSVCNRFHMPCVGIRIISNNELLHEKLEKEISIKLQQEIVNILKRW